MTRYLVFNKSTWNEPPRLRHQVTRMVHHYGGEVLFVQKPRFPWRKPTSGDYGVAEGAISLTRTQQLIHHQLRIWQPLARLNAAYEKRSIKNNENIHQYGKDSIILNFNYDYFFLRELFPKNKILTFINDDFVAQAKFFRGNHVKNALAATCQISDAVFVVSYPLAEQVSEWCKPILFFPWADKDYIEQEKFTDRNGVLLWAQLDRRVDFDLIQQAAKFNPWINFHLVGPVTKDVAHRVQELEQANVNITVSGSKQLEHLPMTDFFAAIIPYKKGVKDIEAVTLSNKSLRLMAYGLPLVVHGMPYFYEHAAIYKAADLEGFNVALRASAKNFSNLQPTIRDFVKTNQMSDRMSQIWNAVGLCP